MCGLIGYSGSTNYDPNIIKGLMLFNSIDRGKDATGFYNTKQGLIKKAEEAKLFLPDTVLLPDYLLIGHVRAKTIGVNSDKNAHPFNYENLVLAHNGTLQNHYKLLSDYELNFNDYNVDSEMLGAVLNKSMSAFDYNEPITNPEEFFKPLLQYEGAAALIFKDKRDFKAKKTSRLFIYRNSERPLHIGYDDNSNMYISSIPLPLKAYNLKDIEEIDVETVYEIEDGEIINKYPLIRESISDKSKTSYGDLFDFFTSGLFNTDYYDLIDTHIKFNISKENALKYNLKNLTKDKFYYVQDLDYESFAELNIPVHVLVKNDVNKQVSVPIFAFDLTNYDYSVNKYAKTIVDININSDEGNNKKETLPCNTIVKILNKPTLSKLAPKNNPYKVVEIEFFDSKNNYKKRNSTYIFQTKWLYPLTTDESLNFINNLKKIESENKISKKINTQKRLTKIPSEVISLQEFLSLDLETLAKEQLTLNEKLNNAELEPLDVVYTLGEIKQKLDDLTVFIMKNSSKRKNQLDHNILSFNDLYPFLNKLYEELTIQGDLTKFNN